MVEAFATVREAAKRTLGQRTTMCSWSAAWCCTRAVSPRCARRRQDPVATLPIYLNALAARGVHLVTVNDYLARATPMDGPDLPLPRHERRRHRQRPQPGRAAAVLCSDITYGTNNEFGSTICATTWLFGERDGPARHNFAIVDEVDSI